MANGTRSTSASKHKQIAERAYQLYMLEDRAGDHALEHWLRAEREVELMRRLSRAKVPVKRVNLPPLEAWCTSDYEPENRYDTRRLVASPSLAASAAI